MVNPPADEESEKLHSLKNKLLSDVKITEKKWVLLTPHGISTEESITILMNDALAGSSGFPSATESMDNQVFVSIKNWQQFVDGFLEKARKEDLDLVGLVMGARAGVKQWLGWGEVIPLDILEYYRNEVEVAVLTMPFKRTVDIHSLISYLKEFGKSLYEYLEKLEDEILLIISGDLAHLHSEDGPYGFSEKAALLDEALIRWMKDPKQEHLEKALEFQPEGQACGMAGYIIAQEFFNQLKFKVKYYGYAVPTYFGMAIAAYLRK